MRVGRCEIERGRVDFRERERGVGRGAKYRERGWVILEEREGGGAMRNT